MDDPPVTQAGVPSSYPDAGTMSLASGAGGPPSGGGLLPGGLLPGRAAPGPDDSPRRRETGRRRGRRENDGGEIGTSPPFPPFPVTNRARPPGDDVRRRGTLKRVRLQRESAARAFERASHRILGPEPYDQNDANEGGVEASHGGAARYVLSWLSWQSFDSSSSRTSPDAVSWARTDRARRGGFRTPLESEIGRRRHLGQLLRIMRQSTDRMGKRGPTSWRRE